ncbi:MAG TPA: type II secretion system protein GspK, partial [Planctomycetota bacterium]|nr:type II secretion system protein GspK [Planctomycetota bacterium]
AQVKAVVVDTERFVNLGRLVDDKGEAVPAVADALRRLVRLLRHPPDVADRIVDYVDADRKGAYEMRARNEPLMNAEELLRVEGIKPEVLYGGDVGGDVRKGILEFVTVWPRGKGSGPATVNVNTAPSEVLQSLADEMTPQAAEAIIAWRMQPGQDLKPQGFKTVDDVKKVPGLAGPAFEAIKGSLAVTSTTFEVRVRSAVNNVEKAWVYVVKRDAPKDGKGGGVKLLANQRLNDFLTVKPPEELRD